MLRHCKLALWGIALTGSTFISYAIAGSLPALPEPVTNNAVALVHTSQGQFAISFMGLAAKKDHSAAHNQVWALAIGEQQWRNMTAVPGTLPLSGRLASVAVGIGDSAYLFGGYTVAADHSEVSSPDNFKYDVVNDRYTRLANMPVPVDDAVALAYQDRYIYLISGWHNDGNVNLVQVYDVQTDTWQQASPFLGQAVFGHGGGIVGNQMLICDGVKVVPYADKRRSFAMHTGCYYGKIDDNNPLKIDWRLASHPTGIGRYRMAAAGVANGRILFAGGSTNPYNYNGIGYNGEPAQPDNMLWEFKLSDNSWQVQKSAATTMDHRGLLVVDGNWLTLGGMGKNQEVLNTVTVHKEK